MLERLISLFERLVAALAKRPATSFFILLGLLFGMIALGHFLRTPPVIQTDIVPETKETALFDLAHDTAFITVPAKVKKESVIHIVALAPGIVSDILTSPGRSVFAEQVLLTLTNDYRGGGTDLQKRLANENARLTAELATIDKDISALEEKKTRRDDTLSNTEEDIALQQLKKNRATRKSTLEQSALSAQLANISDAVLKPKIFTNGVVQGIRVKRGDIVSPGQVLATISTPRGATTLETFLDSKMARLFSATEESTLKIGNDTITLLPTYFAQSENENGLFSVTFTLSEEIAKKIINGEYLKISLPLRHNTETLALVPIDALFQNENAASVLIEQAGVAVSRTVTLGNVYGSYAEVLSGLEKNDRIVLSRAVISGDRISVK